METTPRLISVLTGERTFKIFNRQIIQQEWFPLDRDGAPTREFIRKAVGDGLLARFGNRNELYVQVAPVYLPTEKGCCLLATHTGNMEYLLDCSPRINAQDVSHHLGVSRKMLDFTKAIACQDYVKLDRLATEHCILNPNESDQAKKRKLFTVIGKSATGGNIICSPDFAALIRVENFTRVLVFEYETGSEGSPSRCAARKSPGYFGLNKQQFYKQYFGSANDMRVIAICPNAGWREGFRRALKERPGHELWLTCAAEDLRPETYLHSPIFYTCAEEAPRCLVKPKAVPAATPLLTPLQEVGAR